MDLKVIISTLCDRMVASIEKYEKGARKRGALAGVEIARSLTSLEEFERVLKKQYEKELELRAEHAPNYWEHRYTTLQIEYVFEVLKVHHAMYPLSARAAWEYAQIVGN